jgi:hypothetical protein
VLNDFACMKTSAIVKKIAGFLRSPSDLIHPGSTVAVFRFKF